MGGEREPLEDAAANNGSGGLVVICVRRDSKGRLLVIAETVAGLFCETQHFLNFMCGGGNLRKSVRAQQKTVSAATKKIAKRMKKSVPNAGGKLSGVKKLKKNAASL